MRSREKIISAALDAFHCHGYVATSVDTLLERTGVSKSNFYYHFRSKEDLGIAVLTRREVGMEQIYESTLRNERQSPADRLEGFVNALTAAQDTVLDRHGCPFGNLVAEMADHSERLREHLSGMFGRMAAQIALCVSDAQAAGQIAADIDPGTAAHLLVAATQGMHLMARCHKVVEPGGDACRLAVRLLCAAGTASTQPTMHDLATAGRATGTSTRYGC